MADSVDPWVWGEGNVVPLVPPRGLGGEYQRRIEAGLDRLVPMIPAGYRLTIPFPWSTITVTQSVRPVGREWEWSR